MLFATQNILTKLFIDPEVDEKVSKVVDVDAVEEVRRKSQTKVLLQNSRSVRDGRQNEDTGPNLHGLFVASSLVRISAQNIHT